MGLLDIFKAGDIKRENDELKTQIANMQSVLTPEMRQAINIQNAIQEKQNELEETKAELSQKQNELTQLFRQIGDKKGELIEVSEEVELQQFGLYRPHYDFASSLDYKDKLQEVRQTQKQMIKDKTAVTGDNDWVVNGSKQQGNKMVSDMQKLLLRAFNSECDDVISRVKYTNFDSSLNKIQKSAETISKLGRIMKIAISYKYIDSKVDELRLAFEYRYKKQVEKEQASMARAEMREAAKLQKEIEEQRKKLEKEHTHYQTAYEKICNQLREDPSNSALAAKKEEIEAHIQDVEKSLRDVDYREANQKAGYVYVISNIGAFGENVYKIGMTRRLDPQDRVDELGDASVPFNFDVHAMIFSDDAPALEAALHRAFENKKVNMVNHRREFFNVTLDEIKEVVKSNFDKTVEFVDIPDAEQYRISQKMRNTNI